MRAPARQTPPINPENYTLRFPQDKKWVVQNSCPKVGLSFFGKKGQHFCDSIRSGLSYNTPGAAPMTLVHVILAHHTVLPQNASLS